MSESAWEKFISSILPEKKDRDYLRAMLAYAFRG
jgi:hypothetical protein